MSRLTIDCADPNDFESLRAAVEEAAGRCNITYAKQAQALVDAGTAQSERAAIRQIASDTGESPETVKTRVRRGKIEMGSLEPKPKPKDEAEAKADVGSSEPMGTEDEDAQSIFDEAHFEKFDEPLIENLRQSEDHRAFALVRTLMPLSELSNDRPDLALELLLAVSNWLDERIGEARKRIAGLKGKAA